MSHEPEFELDLDLAGADDHIGPVHPGRGGRTSPTEPDPGDHALGWGVARRLVRGGLRADAIPLLLVALLVLGASTTAAAGPRALKSLADRALRQNVAAASLDARSLTVGLDVVDTGAEGTAFADFQNAIAQQLGPVAARTLTGTSHTYRAFGVTTDGDTVAKPSGLPPVTTFVDDSRAAHLVTYVDGTAPDRATPAPGTVAVGVSRRTSEDLHLPVGTHLRLGDPQPDLNGVTHPVVAVVSGIFEPAVGAALTADDNAFFAQNTTLLTPQLSHIGTLTPRLFWTGELLVSDMGLATLLHGNVKARATAQWRRTVDPAALSVAAISTLRAALLHFQQGAISAMCDPYQPGTQMCGGLMNTVQAATAETGLPDLFTAFRTRLLATSALESFAVAGLLAVELAAVFAAARLVAARRAAAVALQRARGSSRRQSAVLLAAESALVIVPAAVLGRLLGEGGGQLWPTLVVAVFGIAAVPVTVMVRAKPETAGTARADERRLLSRGRRRTLEALVAVLAVGGVLALRGRGVAGTTAGGTVDPLMATVPVLVGGVVSILAVRALPRPVLAAARLLGRGRSTAGWLGLARAAERGQTPAVALAVLVLTVSGAVFGGVVVSTLDHGETASADRVGADAVVRSQALPQEAVDRLRALPGVRADTVTVFERSTVDDDTGAERPVAFLGVGPTLVPGLSATADPDGTIPVLASPAAVDDHPAGTFTVSFLTSTISCRIAGVVPDPDNGVLRAALGPAGPRRPYVVLPAELLAKVSDATRPSVAALSGPVTTAQIRAALLDAGPFSYDVTVRAERLTAMRSDGLNRSVTGIFGLCAAGSAAFAVLVVILELAATARERGRTVSFLRTMGLPARSAGVVTAVQLVPTALAAATAGVLIGLILPRLLGPALDLTAFTDGYDAPIRVDLTVTLLLGLALLLVTAVAAALEAVVGRGRRLAGVLRFGGE
ncbi:FtsX-like permease family protein [Catenulispora subtropica]|uniref:ABC3 transporter permease C-terminal domain-containing protein n=1 Tax=Catenulispora subtropica TaxID=450798 RepID=A0ABN2TCA6_9ACTN